MMDDLISRQAAIDLCDWYDNPSMHDDLEKLPSAQPERKKGKWIRVAGMNERCSVCNQYFPLSDFTDRPFWINFCPNCGADMRGEEHDNTED